MVQKSIREFGMFIDKAVYGVVSWLMQLIMDLSNVEIFNESIIDEFASRIYIILGLVMLFKIMISFIQMLINPDKMSDKEQGAGNILKRVVISLALIFLVPSIFDLARQVQGEIIPIIPKVVLGVNVEGDNSETWTSVGRTMAFYSFSPFFGYQNPECAKSCTIIGTCSDDGKAEIYDVSSASSFVVATDNCSTDKNGFMYSYSWPLSTLVGAYLVYVLVSIAVSVAIRAIKLSVCELVAPIPIASYIDPKSSKQTFDKWVSTTLKTYADLFIRLIIVYFVVFVLQTLLDSDVGIVEQILANVGNDNFRKSLVVLFIIVGLLQFAKQAPKFIGDMLGFSGAGDFMGMFKGEGWKTLGGLAGTVGAAVGAGVGNARYAWKNGERLRSVFRGLGGATAAAGRGLVATANGKGIKGSFSENIRTTTANSQRSVNKRAISRQSMKEYNDSIDKLNSDKILLTKRRDQLIRNLQDVDDQLADAIAAGDTMRINKLTNVHNNLEGRIADKNSEISKIDTQVENVPKPITPFKNNISGAFNSFTGMQSVSGASILEASSALSSMRSTYYTGEAMKKLTEEGSKLTEILSMGATYSEVASAYESLRNGSVSSVTINGRNYTSSDIQQVGELYKTAEKEAAINYINAVKDGRIKNSTIEEGFKQIYGALDGMGLDAKTKNELISEFNKDPGKFLKSLSDVSKRLETEGKRRQAYEREQKKGS